MQWGAGVSSGEPPQNPRTAAEMELGRSEYSNLSLFLPPVSFQALLLAEPGQKPEGKGDREMPFLGVSPLGTENGCGWDWGQTENIPGRGCSQTADCKDCCSRLRE